MPDSLMKENTKTKEFRVYICQMRRFTRPLKNAQLCSRSRKAKILTTGIPSVFRGLRFESDAEIGQKSAFFKGLFTSVYDHPSPRHEWGLSAHPPHPPNQTTIYPADLACHIQVTCLPELRNSGLGGSFS